MSPELQRILARLTIGMIEYMNDADSGYTENDVDLCRSRLDDREGRRSGICTRSYGFELESTQPASGR